jgi:hypothetical protein
MEIRKGDKMKKFTSYELSKKLWDGGCRLDNEFFIFKNGLLTQDLIDDDKMCYPAFDILWDICLEHNKEFFSDRIEGNFFINVFKLVKYGETQEEIEKYIWANCVFNKENKDVAE